MDDVNRKIVEILPSTDLGGAEVALLARLRTLAKSDKLPSTTVVDLGMRAGQLASEIMHYANIEHAPSHGTVRWLHRLLVSLQADLVVCHSPRGAILTCLATRSVRPQLLYVVMAHGTIISESRLKSAFIRFPLRLANRNAAKVIAVSTPVASGEWARGAKKVEISILGSQLVGTEIAGKEPIWPIGTNVKMLSMSRLTPNKNYAMLINAVAQVQSELRQVGAVCALVGSGPSEAALKSQSQLLGVHDLIRFLPATASPGEIMKIADLFLIPSLSEGGPLTLYEALLAGCRILSTKVGVAPEIINKSDDAGLKVIKGLDPQEFGTSLLALAQQGPIPRYEREQRMKKFAYLDSSACALKTQRLIMSAASDSPS